MILPHSLDIGGCLITWPHVMNICFLLDILHITTDTALLFSRSTEYERPNMMWYQLKVAIGQKCPKKERGNKELNSDLLTMNNSSYQNHKSWLTALFINTQDSQIRPSCMERAERTACINGKKKNCEALRNERKWTENEFIFVIFW